MVLRREGFSGFLSFIYKCSAIAFKFSGLVELVILRANSLVYECVQKFII